MYPFSELPAPLTLNQFYVLLVLAHGDAHAYKIKYKIREFSKGSIKPRDGSIYALLERMAYKGMIEVAGPVSTGARSKPRVHYSLGHHGKRALRFELDRMEHAMGLARSAGLIDGASPTPVDMLLEDLGY